MTDDILLTQGPDGELSEEVEETEGLDSVPPPNLSEDGELEEDDDETALAEGFTPVEGEEAGFDPENPDDYLYNTPQIKYSDSAEEGESDWVEEEEF
jgi:hypothetical protein